MSFFVLLVEFEILYFLNDRVIILGRFRYVFTIYEVRVVNEVVFIFLVGVKFFFFLII